jgi:hypothetical protein
MCTVSFIRHKDGFSLTSNRDEQYERETLYPKIYQENNLNIVYPKDVLAGGTWIATSDTKVSVCLLNGAFKKHKRQLPYDRSRGKVLMERFEYASNMSFVEKVVLDNVEPFTLLMIDHNNFLDFVELVWDGNQKHVRDIDTNQHHIWASSTLYNEEQKLMRQQWFSDFLRNKEELSYKEIIDFHTGSYVKDTSYDIVMERPEIKLKTVSVSQINITQKEKSFFYLDTPANRTEKLNLELCKPV